MAAVGPSVSGHISSSEREPAIAADFSKGVQLLESGPLSEAVELLGSVLEARCEAHGAEAPETASSYFHYGVALLRKAQEDQDVFGAQLQDAARKRGSTLVDEEPPVAEKQDEDEDDAQADAAADEAEEHAHQAATAAADKIAAATEAADDAHPSAEAPEAEGEDDDKENGEDGKKEEEGEKEDGEGAGDDMQLAWEMLEMAKLIYSRQAPSPASELADVHASLADISMEQESFEAAADDYAVAMKLLKTIQQEGTRRVAELHYKLALAQQFLELPEAALASVRAAIGILEKILTGLKPAEAEPASFSFGVPEVDANVEAADAPAQPLDPKVAAEIADLQSVLDELWERVDELKEAAASSSSTKSALKAAFAQMAAAGPASSSPPSPSAGKIAAHQPGSLNGLAPAAAADGSTEAATGTTAAPNGSAPAAAAFSGSAALAGSGAAIGKGSVQDLGVVGRGKRRITLQPQRNEEAVKRSKAEGPFTFGLPEIAAAATEQQAAKPDAAVAFDGSSLPVANGSHA